MGLTAGYGLQELGYNVGDSNILAKMFLLYKYELNHDYEKIQELINYFNSHGMTKENFSEESCKKTVVNWFLSNPAYKNIIWVAKDIWGISSRDLVTIKSVSKDQLLNAQKQLLNLMTNKVSQRVLKSTKMHFVKAGYPAKELTLEAIKEAVVKSVAQKLMKDSPDNRKITLSLALKQFNIVFNDIVPYIPQEVRSNFSDLLEQYLDNQNHYKTNNGIFQQLVSQPFSQKETQILIKNLSNQSVSRASNILSLLVYDWSNESGKAIYDFLLRNINTPQLSSVAIRTLLQRGGKIEVDMLDKVISNSLDKSLIQSSFLLLKQHIINDEKKALRLLFKYLKSKKDIEVTLALETVKSVGFFEEAIEDLLYLLQTNKNIDIQCSVIDTLKSGSHHTKVEEILWALLTSDAHTLVKISAIKSLPLNVTNDKEVFRKNQERIVKMNKLINTLTKGAVFILRNKTSL